MNNRPKNAMYLLLFFVGFVLHSGSLQAQNLVLNPSFEGNAQCPNNLDNIGQSPGAGDLMNWYSPTDGQPDYFNTCAVLGSAADAPNNLYGYQVPQTGDGYAGFTAYAPNNGRDYLTVQLSEELTPGKSYCVNFDVNLADFTYVAVENIGLYFSDNAPINLFNGGVNLAFTPQITNNNGVIINTSGWTTISGTFTPSTPIEYITIGNFSDNANTNTIDLSSPGVVGFADLGYYYVDDVSVVELPDITTTVSINQGSTDPVTGPLLVCEGDELTFTASSGANSSFSWAALSDPFTPLGFDNTLTETVNASESFIVTVVDDLCTRRDTIAVQVATKPEVDFEIVSACEGYYTQFFDLSTGAIASATYEWAIDLGGNTVIINTAGGAGYTFPSAGTYDVTLTITNAGNCFNSITKPVEIRSDCNPCNAPTLINNWVPNPNFEAYTNCPDDLAELNAPTVSLATPWFQPSAGTSDFYHACGDGTDAGSPDNFFGSQAPLSGNGYLGFYAKRINDYREYLSVELLDEMTVGKRYCVSYNVSLADNSDVAIENIGLHLSPSQISAGNTTAPLFSYTPQINNSNGVIADKLNWTKISGTYTATQAMKWLTIGNFNDNTNTNFTTVGGSLANDSYYYVEDVVVTELPDLTFSGAQNLQACTNQPVSIAVTGNYCQFTWVDADNPMDTVSNNAILNVTSSTTGIQNYAVLARFGDCIVSDTVTIEFFPVPTPDFEVVENCAGAITIFKDQSSNVVAGASYEWIFGDADTLQNASGIVTHLYQTPGTYNVKLVITNPSGCQNSITVPYTVSAECDPCAAENNILSNPSFELQNACPSSLGALGNADFWEVPTGGQSPDYFDSCSSGNVDVPDNFFGSQEAHTGDAYAGIIAYRNLNGVIVPGDQEFFSTPLSTVPLDPGQEYCVKMFVSLADSSDYAIDELGFYFSNGIPTGTLQGNVSPQVANEVFNIITDKDGWTEVAGTFTPSTAFDYLTIGNFDDNDTDINTALVGQDRDGIAYYYIDDISIVPLNMSVSASSQTVCLGESVTLTGTTNTCEFYWVETDDPDNVLSSDLTLTVSPTSTTTYEFVGNNGTCATTRQITIEVLPLPSFTDNTNSVSICEGASIDLDATSLSTSTDSVQWAADAAFANILSAPQAPFNTSTITVSPSTTTTYYRRVINNSNGCMFMDSVTVVVNTVPVANAGNSLFVCPDDTVRLGASGGNTYAWSIYEPTTADIDTILSASDISDPFISPNPGDTLQLIVTVSNSQSQCFDTDTVTVIGRPRYDIPTEAVAICSGNSATLGNSLPANITTIQWSPSIGLSADNVVNPVCSATSSTSYTVNFMDNNGCEGIATVAVNVFPIPSAGPDVQICLGASIQLSGSFGGDAYLWTDLSGNPAASLDDPTLQNPIASPTITTSYVLNVTYPDNSGGCSQTDTVQVVVTESGFADAGEDVEICPGDQTTLNAVGGDTYEWLPAIGLSATNVPNPIASPTATTTYSVTVTNSITNCISVDDVIVVVDDDRPAPVFLSDDLEIQCIEAFVPATVCYDFNYTGCETLTTKITTQLGSNVTRPNDTCFVYNSAFNGSRTDTTTIQICTPNQAQCAEIKRILVNCDTPPEWAQDTLSLTTCSDFTSTFTLPGVIDESDDILTYSISDAPTSGTANIVNSNELQYTGTGSGTDQLTVRVCDSLYPANECADLTVLITNEVNTAPSFSASSYNFTTDFETLLPFCVSITDAENDPINLTVANAPNNGTLTPTNTNCFNYVPNAGYSGVDALVLEATDDCGKSSSVTITITIAEQNLPPVVDDTSVNTTISTPVTICPNISDPNGDAVSLFGINAPNFGTFSLDGNCIDYTPFNNVVGLDSMDVRVCDPFGLCDTATVYINIQLPPNDPPVANDTIVFTPCNTNIQVCPTVFEPDGQSYTISVTDGTDNGQLFPQNNGTCFIYIPDFGFSGRDDFQIQACDPFGECDIADITIFVEECTANTPPFAPADTIRINPGSTGVHCFNATDAQGDNITYTILSENPSGAGKAELDTNGCLTYSVFTETEDGTVDIEVEMCDDQDPALCSTTTLTVIIFTPELPPNVESITTSTPEGTAVDLCYEISDPNGDPTTISILENGNNGNASILNDTCISYLPNPGFVGTDTIFVDVCDDNQMCTTVFGIINVFDSLGATDDNTTAENGIPVTINAAANDTIPDIANATFNVTGNPNNGTVVNNGDGTFSYTSDPNFTGTDSFTYEVCYPNLGCETATVTIVVGNDLEATDDFETTNIDQSIIINAIDNDIYPDSDNLTVTVLDAPANGIITPNATNGTFTYLPNSGFVGADSYTYQICYPNLSCDTATVIINIVALPIAVDDNVSTDQDTDITIAILGNDSDPNTNGDLITSQISVAPNNGAATINPDGTVTYTPNFGFTGIDSFTYITCNDLLNVCDEAVVYVTVVSTENCELVGYNVLTPNDDGKNDVFVIDGLATCNDNQDNELFIYNRWGNVVYSTVNYGTGSWWDGSFKDSGNLVPDGTYYYVLQINNSDIQLQGYVEVYR